MSHFHNVWQAPIFAEIKMDAEIGSYQQDPLEGDPPIATDRARVQRARTSGRGPLGVGLLAAMVAFGSAHTASAAGFPVWTNRIGPGRGSWNGLEFTFTPTSMGSGTTFQRRATWVFPAKTGQIVGQLLYAPAVPLPTGETIDLIIAATTRDYLLFFDANNLSATTPRFTLNLSNLDSHYGGSATAAWTDPPHTAPACNFLNDGGQFQPYSGITSTPHVSIDNSTLDGILYVVDKAYPLSEGQGQIDCTKQSTNGIDFSPPATTFFRIWSIDLNKLGTAAQIHMPPEMINSTHASLAAGGPAIKYMGGTGFDPLYEDQRPGLLVWNNASIYVGFAAAPADYQMPLPSDNPPGNGTGAGPTTWHGWLMKFSTNLVPSGGPQAVWMSTNSSMGRAGGIWQGGNGIAVTPDQTKLVFATGNGKNQTVNGVTDWGDSMITLDMNTLNMTGHYVPDDFVPYGYTGGNPNYENEALDNADMDLSSAGPLTTSQNTIIQAGKDGLMRGFDGSLSRIDGPFHATFPVAGTQHCFPRLDHASDATSPGWPRFYGGPAYWSDNNGNGVVYVWGAKDFPRAYGYTSYAGVAFFYGVHFVSKTEAPGVQVTYCDTPACNDANCVNGANLSPPLINPDYNTTHTPHSSPRDVYEVANNLPGNLTAPNGVPGGALTLSGSYGNGILWASINNPFGTQQDSEGHYTLGSLVAFDAQTMQTLWSNEFTETYGYVKYAPPTVTNGFVYLPGLQVPQSAPTPPDVPPNGPALDSQIQVYGL